MAESLVKTFKRDYVCLSDLPDAITVIEKLTEWMEDDMTGIRIKVVRVAGGRCMEQTPITEYRELSVTGF